MSRNLESRTNLGVIKGREIWSMRTQMVIIKCHLHVWVNAYFVLPVN